MKKSLAALALAGSIVLIGSAPAMAVTPAPYPAPPSSGSVSRGTVAPGQVFTATLRGFRPFERVTIAITLRTTRPQAIGGSFSGGASMAVPAKITLPLAPQTFTVTADAEGTVVIPLSLDEAGDYTITATGASGTVVTTSVTVDPDAADPVNNDDDGTDTGTDGNSDNDETDGGTITLDGNGTVTGTNGGNGTGTGNGTAITPNSTDTAEANSGLANTGADTNLVLWSLVGAGALAAGVTSVVVVRRRAKADATA